MSLYAVCNWCFDSGRMRLENGEVKLPSVRWKTFDLDDDIQHACCELHYDLIKEKRLGVTPELGYKLMPTERIDPEAYHASA